MASGSRRPLLLRVDRPARWDSSRRSTTSRSRTASGLVDEWLGVDASLDLSQPGGIWTTPIQTVSQSEGGFELVHQSTAVIPHWNFVADETGCWSVRIRMTLDTSAAQARMLATVGGLNPELHRPTGEAGGATSLLPDSIASSEKPRCRNRPGPCHRHLAQFRSTIASRDAATALDGRTAATGWSYTSIQSGESTNEIIP